ncbi:MAG: hypothetical protein M0P20_05595 [Methanocorpusculum sp.]|nr:hypothetical protein [Methanocorpusculum sp.]
MLNLCVKYLIREKGEIAMPYTSEKVVSLIQELRKLQHEVPWVEFKSNNFNRDMIGEYISALSNSAARKVD